METAFGIGLLCWSLAGVLAVVNRALVFRKERMRQRQMLKCDWSGCFEPADQVWVADDDVRGLCNAHFEIDQEEEDDGDDDGRDGRRPDPGGSGRGDVEGDAD